MKLYFGNGVTTATLMILAMLGFIGYSVFHRASIQYWGRRSAILLVFCRSEERGKCFIEYIPAENAWVPIAADGYLFINCLWVSGSMQGHGYSNDLPEECIRDAKAHGKNGICIKRQKKSRKPSEYTV